MFVAGVRVVEFGPNEFIAESIVAFVKSALLHDKQQYAVTTLR